MRIMSEPVVPPQADTPAAASQSSAAPALSTLSTGLRARCPRCGKGPVFRGFLTLRDSCPECGLSYAFADPADGPAFFVMSGVGFVIMTLFAWVEITMHPPIWVHFAITLPLALLACLGTLRPVKGWMISEQYVHKAEEAKFSSVGKHGEGSRWR
jgi:uncharacterized protein (DUF983 family)